MAHDSIGCIKLLNRDQLHTVNITENFGFHHVGVRRQVRESVWIILETADIFVLVCLCWMVIRLLQQESHWNLLKMNQMNSSNKHTQI